MYQMYQQQVSWSAKQTMEFMNKTITSNRKGNENKSELARQSKPNINSKEIGAGI